MRAAERLPRPAMPAAAAAAAAVTAPIRLLKFIPAFGFGGTERQVVGLTARLDRTRFDLRMACMRRWGHFLEEVERRQHLAVAEYPLPSFYSVEALRQTLRFAADLRRERIRIVHSYNFYANAFCVPAARLAKVPCVIASIRDSGAYQTPWQHRVHRRICAFADRVVVNAEAIKRWLVGEGYRAERIVVIRNGIDVARFSRRAGDGRLRAELGLEPGARIVLLLARLVPQKGIEHLLDAAPQVLRRHPRAVFVVVGADFRRRQDRIESDDAYQRTLERRAEQLGVGQRVRFIGFRDDVVELLSEAAVSVLPSLDGTEGLSNAVLESMATGTPVVATAVGGTPELIDDGVHGLLVPPRDAPALAQAISAVLGDAALAARLSAQARRRVEAEFSFERMVQQTEDLYLSLLEEVDDGRDDAG